MITYTVSITFFYCTGVFTLFDAYMRTKKKKEKLYNTLRIKMYHTNKIINSYLTIINIKIKTISG